MSYTCSNEKTKGSLLVVDDEPFIAKYIGLVLGREGYDVLTAFDAETAWELFLKEASRIRAVVTDIVMPGAWDGLELARRVRKVAPTTPVLLVTGYPPEESSGPGYRVLPKPFTAAALQAILREMVEPAASLATAGAHAF
ncbi:MAG: response regulator [Verrucomicrobia bacterium]|nr:response regulator [Verrucomicrobiota bacterium]